MKKDWEYKLNREDLLKMDEFREQLDLTGEALEKEVYRLWMRWKCLTDLFFFGAEVMGLREARDPKSGRHRLDPKLHKHMAQTLQSPKDTLQLLPRGHMKSAWMKYRVAQAILQNPMGRYGLWTKTTSLARKELKAIKGILAHPILQYLFPDIVPPPKKWERSTADMLCMMRPESDYVPQEGQVEVWGIESVVVGHHYDGHFYDDILDDKTIRTAEQIEKLESWWQHVQAIKEVHAFEKMIGTRYHYHDLYGRIIEEDFFDRVITRSAIENGKPIYSFFTLKDLEKLRKRMGDYVFSCQYMNEVVAMQDKIFVPPYPKYTHTINKPTYYLTVDPATGKQYSNRTGICVAAVEENQAKCYIEEAYGINAMANDVADEIVKKIVQYKPERVGIELGLQQALKPLIDMKLEEKEKAEHVGIVRPIFIDIPTTFGRMSKPQKIARTLGAMVRDGRVLFRPHLHELFHQMDFLNPNSDSNEDDIVDAASMMMMIIPNFHTSRWWMNDMKVDYGYTIENFMKEAHNKGRYSKLAV